MPTYRLDIPPHVAEIIRHLPPDLKRAVKGGLQALGRDPALREPLLRELEGLWKYRVRRFRNQQFLCPQVAAFATAPG